MATWTSPFTSKRRAEEFAKRMSSPWLAEIKIVKTPKLKTVSKKRSSGSVVKTKVAIPGQFETHKQFKVDSLHRLAGSDELFDAIQDRVNRSKTNFDARPLIKRFVSQSVVNILKRPGKTPPSYSAIVVVQKSLGLKESPTQKKKYANILKNRRAKN